jgi:hypothetical protein
MKSEKARQYFLERKTPQIVNKNLLESLNKLSLSYENQLDLKKFMDELSKIINWNQISSIAYTIDSGNEPKEIQIIINIHAWARKNFSDSIKNGNVDKLIISSLIGDYVFLEPTVDFQWEFINNNIEENLKTLMANIKSEIIVPENALYSDKKYHKDYYNSLTNGSFRGVFDFLSAIERGVGYDYLFSTYISALANICYKINHSLISEAIANYEPILIKMIFNALDPYQVNTIIKEYNGKSPLPLLIGLIDIVNPNGNNKYNIPLEKDYNFINDASIIVKKISERIKTDNLYRYITNCSNIFGNKLWHSIYIAFAIQNPDFLDSYINSIDFSIGFGSENVFDIFRNFASDEIILDNFSIKVYDKYLDFLCEKCAYEQNYHHTEYLEFMLWAVYAKSGKSHTKYSEMLKEVSIDLERALYSWDKNKITMYFTKLIFWIIALKKFENFFNTGEIDLSHTIAIFSNEKYLDIFNKPIRETNIDYKSIADYLSNPTASITIKLPSSSFNSYICVSF